MKEFFKNLLGWALLIVLTPLILLALLIWICTLPFERLRYHRSLYHKDTGEKFYLGSGHYINIYDTVKKYGLPFTFLRCPDSQTNADGYWIIKNAAVTYGFGVMYREDKKQWCVEEEDEEGDWNQWFADLLLDTCKEIPGGEHCDFIYLLVNGKDVPEDAVLAFDTYRIVPTNLKKPLHSLHEIVKEQTGD